MQEKGNMQGSRMAPRASAMAVSALVAFVAIASAASVSAQVFRLTREEMIRFTEKSPYERFADGRPKVPDALLEKVRGMSAEEFLGLAQRGYPHHYAGGFQVLHPGKKLVGRAMTVKLMPTRADIADVAAADWKASHPRALSHQSAIDMLQPGDVLVVDASGSVEAGGIIGDNLAYYIWKATGAGFVIDGAIRDLEGVFPFEMGGYFRAAVPPAIRGVMVAGINVPVQVGEVTVMPGDVVLGDREGVSFIPPHLVQELVDEADITHIHDEWTKKKFDEGKYRSGEIYGRPTDPALVKEYEDYLKNKLGPERYERYQKSRAGSK